jgi:hypothetical protein
LKFYQLLKREGSEPLEGEKAFYFYHPILYLQRKKEKDCGVGKMVSRARSGASGFNIPPLDEHYLFT